MTDKTTGGAQPLSDEEIEALRKRRRWSWRTPNSPRSAEAPT